MATGLGTGPHRRASALLVRLALIAFLAAGILAMHALAGGSIASATHAEMGHGAVSAPGASTAVAAVSATESGDAHDAATVGHCGVGGICLALAAAGLLLLAAGRVRRPLLARRRAAATLTLRRLLALARLPEPPDLHSLSILRC